MKMNDEYLNRYIDGEMRKEEREEFEKLLASSPELRRNLEAMKLVHSSLMVLKEESPSVNFSSIVMSRISNSNSFRRSQNYFIGAVIGLFSVLCLAAAGYFFIGIFSNAGDSSYTFPDIAVTVNKYVSTFTDKTVNVINPKYFSFAGYFAASLLLLAGYMFFENLKNLKRLKKSH